MLQLVWVIPLGITTLSFTLGNGIIKRPREVILAILTAIQDFPGLIGVRLPRV